MPERRQIWVGARRQEGFGNAARFAKRVIVASGDGNEGRTIQDQQARVEWSPAIAGENTSVTSSDWCPKENDERLAHSAAG